MWSPVKTSAPKRQNKGQGIQGSKMLLWKT
jgi:hypothetical protein